MVMQNFIETFEKGSTRSVLEYPMGPCIILFHAYPSDGKTVINYCHFDECHFDELAGFVIASKEIGANKIGFFGGYGSRNAVSLLRMIKREGLETLTDKDFVSSPPVRQLNLDKDGISFGGAHGDVAKYTYSSIRKYF